MSSYSLKSGLKNTMTDAMISGYGEPFGSYDLVIRFLAAEGLPKTDIFSDADPYFIATIDNKITYKSAIMLDNSSPRWDDEQWTIRNVPLTAQLSVGLFDKDVSHVDDEIGRFEVLNVINYHAPFGGHDIVTPSGEYRGRFHISIQAIESPEESKQLPKYTFDGPCHYFRRDSAAAGWLTTANDDCVYSTWSISMRRISVFFSPFDRQFWDKNYKNARNIFGSFPVTFVWRDIIKLAHTALYGKTLKHTESGRLNSSKDLWKFIFSDNNGQRRKPCIYTYAIDDNTWRFSETSEQVFTHFVSKHAVIVNGLESVRYAGEFHPRPKNGWDKVDDDDGEWELVFDNGSGTYSPNVEFLVNLKELLLFNFPGLNVVTYDYDDPICKASKDQLLNKFNK